MIESIGASVLELIHAYRPWTCFVECARWRIAVLYVIAKLITAHTHDLNCIPELTNWRL